MFRLRVGGCFGQSWNLTAVLRDPECRLQPPSPGIGLDYNRELKRHKCRAPFASYKTSGYAFRTLRLVWGQYPIDKTSKRVHLAECNTLKGRIASCIALGRAKERAGVLVLDKAHAFGTILAQLGPGMGKNTEVHWAFLAGTPNAVLKPCRRRHITLFRTWRWLFTRSQPSFTLPWKIWCPSATRTRADSMRA